MSLGASSPLPRLQQRCAASSEAFRPFVVDGYAVGRVNQAIAGELRRWPAIFSVSPDRVMLSPHLDTVEVRTQALAEIAQALHADGFFSGWRNETYCISTEYGAAPIFHLERAAMRAFGLTMHAAHVNAVIGHGHDCRMWLARRSVTKPIDPGLYDTLVGGGLASGLGIAETVVKESWEEAGIAAAIAGTARLAGTVRVRRMVPEGWHEEVIFVHDLWLPAGFQPLNQDGEVGAFLALPLADIFRLVCDTDQVTVEASCIISDFMMRSGFIPSVHPDYQDLRTLMRNP